MFLAAPGVKNDESDIGGLDARMQISNGINHDSPVSSALALPLPRSHMQ